MIEVLFSLPSFLFLFTLINVHVCNHRLHTRMRMVARTSRVVAGGEGACYKRRESARSGA